VCGRKLKVLLLVLFLLSLPLVYSYSEVVLTDSEYSELLTALTEAEKKLNKQEKTIEELKSKSKQQQSTISELESLAWRQGSEISQLSKELKTQSESLKQLKKDKIKSSIMWSSIGLAVGAFGAGIVLSQ
jgi:peptidoglycan hydrolase CwlO-like protein